MRQDRHREAWTAFVEGRDEKPSPKYGNERTGQYASKREAQVATQLAALFAAGKITDLREQVNIVLVPGQGKMRPIVWRADFVYNDLDGVTHYLDAKGFRTPVYRLKRRLFMLLHGKEIEEV